MEDEELWWVAGGGVEGGRREWGWGGVKGQPAVTDIASASDGVWNLPRDGIDFADLQSYLAAGV